MKKIFLTTVGTLACMSMMATSGTDLKDGVKMFGSRADYVTQTEALMSALCADGFGLDAIEYELMMTQEFDMFDDMAGTIVFPSCAGDAPDLQKRIRDWDEPLPPPVRGKANADDLPDNPNGSSGGSSFEDMIKGNVRPGNEPMIGGSRPTKPIGPGPIEPIATINSDNGNDDNVKGSGNGRPNGDFPDVAPGGSNGNGSGDEGVDGGRPTKPIGPGPIDF